MLIIDKTQRTSVVQLGRKEGSEHKQVLKVTKQQTNEQTNKVRQCSSVSRRPFVLRSRVLSFLKVQRVFSDYFSHEPQCARLQNAIKVNLREAHRVLNVGKR